jgi:ABC-type glycerol-3-phosphate transport system permease component
LIAARLLVSLAVMLAWNEFLFALTLSRFAFKTAPVGISEFAALRRRVIGPVSRLATNW